MAKKQNNFKTITILLLLLVAVVIGGYVYITYLKNPTFKSLFGDQASSTPVTLSLGEAEQLLKTATIDLDDVSQGVTLVNGNAEFSAEDTPIKGSVTLGNIIEIQKVGDRVDVLTTMVVDYGGSGNFVYLVLFENKQGKLVQKSMVLLGDRVKVSEVETGNSIKTGVDYLVDVFILDRGENESMATVPSVPKTINLSVKSGQLSVIEPVTVSDPKPVTPPTEAVFCTMDAKMCPDGSYVGRSGPNCEFKCPVGESTSTN
jgi:hypothetical protein